MLQYFLIRIACVIGLFLIIRSIVSKCAVTRSFRVPLLATWVLVLITDIVLILTHNDPFFAIVVIAYGDGGSAYFVGPLYYVYKQAAYIMTEEPPFFEYYIAPWFLGIFGGNR